MRTAFTVWNARIAPVFDVAGQALLVVLENGTVFSESNLVLPNGSALEKIAYLADVQVDMLICGAISRSAHFFATGRGMDVHSFIAGDVRAVLHACLEGRLEERAFAMPGCSRQYCWHSQKCHAFRWGGWQHAGAGLRPKHMRKGDAQCHKETELVPGEWEL